jgi:hypothetical protein
VPMAELKLDGMKAAFDEIITAAIKRQHEPQRPWLEAMSRPVAAGLRGLGNCQTLIAARADYHLGLFAREPGHQSTTVRLCSWRLMKSQS